MAHRTTADAVIDHIEFYVTDAAARAADFVSRYNFQIVASAGLPTGGEAYSLALQRREIVLVLTQGLTDDHPASGYVVEHGDVVATIALRVPDAAAAQERAIKAGAQLTERGIVVFGDVIHTFVEREDGEPWLLPGFARWPGMRETAGTAGLTVVDHIAVCLESGELNPTVELYQKAMGWDQIFEEDIHVGAQAMQSKVVQSPNGQVTLTLLQPMQGAQPGQIDDFLKNHGGSGVQHLAFAVPDIVHAVDDLIRRGVRFLETPDAYYGELTQRLTHPAHSMEDLRQRSILADQDHDGQLFQIFTRSEHPRRTFFIELIERQGARTFGSNNIRKLYEAVERQLSADQRKEPNE